MGEKKYLRQCHVELYERGGKASVAPPYDPAFLKQHPRFEALNQLYEDVQHEKRGADASKSKLSSNLVELTIKSPIDAHAEKEPVVKREPGQTTLKVTKVKKEPSNGEPPSLAERLANKRKSTSPQVSLCLFLPLFFLEMFL
jgi:hypothetical protein